MPCRVLWTRGARKDDQGCVGANSECVWDVYLWEVSQPISYENGMVGGKDVRGEPMKEGSKDEMVYADPAGVI